MSTNLKPKKVYVLIEYIPYEAEEIIGIFSSREKAENHKNTLKNKNHLYIHEYEINKPDA